MPGGMGPAAAAAGARRWEMMYCQQGHERVEWEGREVKCWVCGLPGLRKYPDTKNYASVDLLHPKVDPVTEEEA